MYNTLSPVPSKAVKDLSDNTEVLDRFMNSPSPSEPDRFLVRKETLTGLRKMVKDFLESMGFEAIHLTYVNGSPLVVNRPTQLIDRAGLTYAVKQPASFPLTLTGTWATDSARLVDVTASSVRTDLSSPSPNLGASLVYGVPRYVNTVADLISLPSSVTQPVYTLGYAVAGDGGGTGPFVWEPTSTASENGGTIFGTGTGRRVLKNFDTYNIKWFGAVGNGVANDQAATDKFLAAWITDLKDGYVPAGHYMLSGRFLVNVGLNGGKRCPRLYGDGAYSSVFISSSTASPVFHIFGQSAQVGPDHFQGAFDRIGFSADTPGIAFAIGLSDFSDNHGNYNFNQVFFANSNSTKSDSATTLQLNWLFDCSFNQCVVVGNPMYGTALHCRRTHFVHFTSGSYSNAGRAILFSNGGSYSTTFDTYDIENCKFGIYVDDGAAEDLSFNNGYMDIWDPSTMTYPSGAYPIYVGPAQWGGVTVDKIRFGRAQSFLYAYTGGYGVPGAISPFSTYSNLVIRGRFPGQSSPAMPPSDVGIPNNTGQVQIVRISISTSVFINGFEYGNTAGSSHTINPGDVIAVRYSGATPNWQWSALR